MSYWALFTPNNLHCFTKNIDQNACVIQKFFVTLYHNNKAGSGHPV